MSRRTLQWARIADQAGQNHKDGTVHQFIPSERVTGKGGKIVTEPASPRKREIMERAMRGGK